MLYFTKMKNTSNQVESVRRQINAYGFNNFVSAAKTRLMTLSSGTVEYAILKYLIENAVGAENAKVWREINDHIKELGFRTTKNKFQTGLLKHSRSHLYYIGSGGSGYYLIEKQSDVDATSTFYEQRIGGEQANWDVVKHLASKARFEETHAGNHKPADNEALN